MSLEINNKLTATVGLVTASGINGQITGTGTTFTNAVGDTNSWCGCYFWIWCYQKY